MELTEEKLKSLSETIPGNFGIYQIRGQRLIALYLSPSLHCIAGMEKGEYEKVSRDDAADTVIPEDRPLFWKNIENCIRSGGQMNHYWRIRHPQFGYLWVHGNALCCGELDGYPVLIVTYGDDSNEISLYKDVVDNSQTMVYVCDRQSYEVLYANRAARTYGGGDKNQPGCTCYSYIHDRTAPCEDCFMNTMKRDDLLSRDRFNKKHGTWEHLSGKYITWCGHDAFIQYIQDVTEFRTVKKKLEDAERANAEASMAQDIMDSISAGISVLHMPDPDHLSFEYVNQQMFRLLHFSENDNNVAVSRHIKDELVLAYISDGFSGIHPDDLERVRKTFHDHFYSEKFTVSDYRALGGDGRYHWLREDVDLREVTPEYRRFYAAYHDVDSEAALREERDRQLEQEKELRMKAMAANTAKSNFLASMSHDIRTPMNAIVGMTNMAIEKVDDPKQVLEDLRIVQTSARNLLGLINDVLDLSKIESGKMEINSEDFIFPDLLVDLQSMGISMIKAKHQSFHIDANRVDHEFVVGDMMHLKQVLTNLLSNANKYTQYGGKIEMVIEELPHTDAPASEAGRRTADMSDAGHGTEGTSEAGRKTADFRFSVIDNGIGIEKSRMEEIFEPFMREVNTMVNPVEGTGLGLTIVRNIVSAMNGTVEVKSEKNEGSVFTVTVPLGLQDENVALKQFSDVSGAKALLVVNKPERCEEMRRPYLKAGIQCDAICMDEIEAKAEAIRHNYEVVVVFNDSDPLHIIRRVRACAAEQNIFFVCDLNQADLLDEAVSAGADTLLFRPMFKATFFEELQKISRKKSSNESDEKYMLGKRVLVAEDQPINYIIVENLLLVAGAELVEHAENGQAAVEKFSASREGYYDLILMDVMMPVMGGYDATRAIRSLARPDAATVPIVAMTANAFSEDVQKSHAAGMNDHISKPIDPETVRKVLEQVLYRKK
ncbi:MAG: ATP-binding protein [Lachnospiraceae bacterium]|jgi:two-component system sensor histidine kinase/response regulator|nr:ATP-binding protein [Lachnospiraceae bacterium]